MDCKKYRELYKIYSKPQIDQSVWDTVEYQQYIEHFYECESCGKWNMEQKASKKGINVSDYCCTEMAYHLSTGVDVDPYEDPDVIMIHNKKYDEYGIPIQDGGTSFIIIKFCPWCAAKLPDSKRDLWYDKLIKLGFNEPFEDDIPEEFESDKWYKK